MDFFEHQDRARRNTTRLVVLYVLAVASVVAVLYVAVVATLHHPFEEPEQGGPAPTWWHLDTLGWVTFATLLVIGGTTWLRVRSLAAGGTYVAQLLGGRSVHVETRHPAERRLVNVVEEMAIASGIPVPLVFVLDDEEGINAFAAGYDIPDAVVAVTQGALDTLDRDELQGVVAHEFSHLLNGDMRLNLRMVGVLAGLAFIGNTGASFFRGGFLGWNRRRRGGAPWPLFAVALAMIVAGTVGVFFGRLIQAAVSRQRETLADASAVQFTRNPAGLAGALKKIGGWPARSRVTSQAAPEMSHLFFGSAFKRRWLGLLATHPPLAERIRLLDPAFDGVFPEVTPHAPRPEIAPGAAHPTPGPGPVGLAPAQVVDAVGAPRPEHVDYGADLLRDLPPGLREAVHQPVDAVALVYGLLLDPDPRERKRQEAILDREEDPAVKGAIRRLWPALKSLEAHQRLPLLDLAAPGLRALAPARRARLLHVAEAMAASDGDLSLFEFALDRVVRRHLREAGLRRPKGRSRGLPDLLPSCHVALSALARSGHPGDEAGAERALRAGVDRLPGAPADLLRLLPADDCRAAHVGHALDRLLDTRTADRRVVVDACAHAALADGATSIEQAELLRAVASSLDVPMPPLLPVGERLEESGAPVRSGEGP
ncbi:MAG: M48 family metallopeptidase [Myxococcota bacterium]